MPKPLHQPERVHLTDESLVSLVNIYLQKYRKHNGTPRLDLIRKKLGWNQMQWDLFRERAGHLLVTEFIPEFSVLATDDSKQPDNVRQSLEARGLSPETVGRKIEVTYGQLRRDLLSIGLTRDEVDAAVAMQNFGENRFSDAMEMIASGVFKTAAKLQTQQTLLEKRLEDVRAEIADHGPFVSEEREMWVKEEVKLVQQYTSIGKLLSEIQKTWYEGSAQLALVRMRMRDESGLPSGKDTRPTQRTNKPGFRPTVIDVEPQPQRHDQAADQAGNETAPS